MYRRQRKCVGIGVCYGEWASEKEREAAVKEMKWK